MRLRVNGKEATVSAAVDQRPYWQAVRATTGRPRLGRQDLGRRFGGIHIPMPRRRSARRKLLLS